MVKDLAANAGDIKRLGLDPWIRKIPLEEGMTRHYSFPAWRIPWTENLEDYSLWGKEESHTTQVT